MTTATATAPRLDAAQERAITALLEALIDQTRARVVVAPYAAESGYWFGGGNIVEDGGDLCLSGRYRNAGDARTGVAAGTRGLECAVFRSRDGGATFEKVSSFSKDDLTVGGANVLSIEGTGLHKREDGARELFVSTERARSYPAGFEGYQKRGTGVWSIDVMTGPSLDALDPTTMRPVLSTDQPGFLHVKDPVVYDDERGTNLVFCSHPMAWSSSNPGHAVRAPGSDAFEVTAWQLAQRGAIWDVAATRVTNRLVVPAVGVFSEGPRVAVHFYDGAECLRSHEEGLGALSRPRGFSCEELGGAFWSWAAPGAPLERLSRTRPMFVSPHGTGCSRYVSTLFTADALHATWQQGQADGSQPLVMHSLPMADVRRLLAN